jgi:hypothetical protein
MNSRRFTALSRNLTNNVEAALARQRPSRVRQNGCQRRNPEAITFLEIIAMVRLAFVKPARQDHHRMVGWVTARSGIRFRTLIHYNSSMERPRRSTLAPPEVL